MSPQTNSPIATTEWKQRTVPTGAPTIGKVLGDAAPCLAARDVQRLPTLSAEGGRFGPLWVQACSITGRNHLSGPDPTSGQDSYCSLLSAEGSMAVFAVADGLGSRRRSHVGAPIAARSACQRFAQPWARALLDGPTGAAPVPDDVVRTLLGVQQEVTSAESTDAPGREVATTLLVAIVDVEAERPRACFVRVGDPDALLLPDGRFHSRSLVFGAGDDGAANALKACIPMRDPAREIEFVRVGELDANVTLALVSDGVGNDLRSSAQLRHWFEGSWSRPLDASAMVDSLRYRRQGSSDDRTALVVHLRPIDGRNAPQPPAADVEGLVPSVRSAPLAPHEALLAPREAPLATPQRVAPPRSRDLTVPRLADIRWNAATYKAIGATLVAVGLIALLAIGYAVVRKPHHQETPGTSTPPAGAQVEASVPAPTTVSPPSTAPPSTIPTTVARSRPVPALTAARWTFATVASSAIVVNADGSTGHAGPATSGERLILAMARHGSDTTTTIVVDSCLGVWEELDGGTFKLVSDNHGCETQVESGARLSIHDDSLFVVGVASAFAVSLSDGTVKAADVKVYLTSTSAPTAQGRR